MTGPSSVCATDMDALADVVVNGSISEVLPALVDGSAAT
jgi:hypothetical protein